MLAQVVVPASRVVDIIPSLQYLPEWIPGIGFKKEARDLRKVVDEFLEKPFLFVKKKMVFVYLRLFLSLMVRSRNWERRGNPS